jgi:hypothetical protein
MALGVVVLGSALLISVATTTESGGVYTAGTYSPMSDLNRIDYNSNRPVTNIAVFGRSTQYSIPGVKEQTMTLSGFWSEADTGQGIANTAEASNAVIAVKVLRNGTTGYSIFGRIGSIRETAAPEGLQEISYDFLAVTDRTLIP